MTYKNTNDLPIEIRATFSADGQKRFKSVYNRESAKDQPETLAFLKAYNEAVKTETGKSIDLDQYAESDGIIEGLGIPYGGRLQWEQEDGSIAGRDFDGEYFDDKTDYTSDVYDGKALVKAMPVLYDHGMDDTLKSSVIGEVKSIEDTDKGKWFTIQLNRAHEYYKYLLYLAKCGALSLSTGAKNALKALDGHIDRWELQEISLTPSACNPMAQIAIKSIQLIGDMSMTKDTELSASVVDGVKEPDDAVKADDAIEEAEATEQQSEEMAKEQKAEWNESDHPRDENGQWTSGSGTSSSSGNEESADKPENNVDKTPINSNLSWVTPMGHTVQFWHTGENEWRSGDHTYTDDDLRRMLKEQANAGAGISHVSIERTSPRNEFYSSTADDKPKENGSSEGTLDEKLNETLGSNDVDTIEEALSKYPDNTVLRDEHGGVMVRRDSGWQRVYSDGTHDVIRTDNEVARMLARHSENYGSFTTDNDSDPDHLLETEYDESNLNRPRQTRDDDFSDSYDESSDSDDDYESEGDEYDEEESYGEVEDRLNSLSRDFWRGTEELEEDIREAGLEPTYVDNESLYISDPNNEDNELAFRLISSNGTITIAGRKNIKGNTMKKNEKACDKSDEKVPAELLANLISAYRAVGEYLTNMPTAEKAEDDDETPEQLADNAEHDVDEALEDDRNDEPEDAEHDEVDADEEIEKLRDEIKEIKDELALEAEKKKTVETENIALKTAIDDCMKRLDAIELRMTSKPVLHPVANPKIGNVEQTRSNLEELANNKNFSPSTRYEISRAVASDEIAEIMRLR